MPTPKPAPPQNPAESGSRMRWYVLAVVFSIAFVTIVDRVSISAAKAPMARDLAIPDLAFGFVFGAFALGYAAFMVPSGWLADRLGPRRLLAIILAAWSALTTATGLVRSLLPLVGLRFAFGLAQAGAFPTGGRVVYNWFPARERGVALGLLNSGSRIGAAFGLSFVSLLVAGAGWRESFWVLGTAGLLFAGLWYGWFRDDPRDKSGVSPAELDQILSEAGGRRNTALIRTVNWRELLASRNYYLILFQYFCSNFTLFICFTWLLPFTQERYHLGPAEAGFLASVPLYFGAFATWFGGVLADRIFRTGRWKLSRALPAAAGFALAAAALLAAGRMQTAGTFIACFALATLGVDLAIAPSWSVCADVGRQYTGTVSGSMNMFGSVGSFSSSIAFPWLLGIFGSPRPYFALAAALNVAAVFCWMGIDPSKPVCSAPEPTSLPESAG